LVVAACLSTFAFAQQSNQPAKPGSALKKLAVYLGKWKYEGESQSGPSGPTEKFAGNASTKMILRGVAQTCAVGMSAMNDLFDSPTGPKSAQA